MEKLAYEITVKGVVQGVGFRYFTREKALALKLNGTVENLADGSVFIRVEGNVKSVSDFLIWCHAGPDSAKVDVLSYAKCPFLGYRNFEIVR